MGRRALAPPRYHSPDQSSPVWVSFSDGPSSWSQGGCRGSSHPISTPSSSKAEEGPLYPMVSEAPSRHLPTELPPVAGKCLNSAEALSAPAPALPLPRVPSSPRGPSLGLGSRDSTLCRLSHLLRWPGCTRAWENRNSPFPLKLLQEVLTATLDLEDVRSYRAEISSRNLAVGGHPCGMLARDPETSFKN